MVLDERTKDCLLVLVPNGVALAVVNLARLNQYLQLAVGVCAISYTLWRWRRDSYVVCQACREGHPPAMCPLPLRKRPAWCPRNL